MDIRLAAFSSELIKLAEEREKRRSYGQQVAAALPFAVATSAADVPKGWVDKYVDQSIRHVKGEKKVSGLGRGIGRGLGRLGPSIATAPVFLSGLKDLQSEDKSQKRRGYAKVVGSGLTYGALKGGIETGTEEALEKGLKGVSWPKLLKKVRGTAGARGVVAAGAGALTAAAVAKGQKKKEGKKPSFLSQYAAPAAVGAGAGAAKGGFDEAWELGRKATRRGLAARAGGRAAAGALGALTLSEAAKRLMPSKKDPSVKRWQKVKTAEEVPKFGPSSGELYDQVRGWTKSRNDVDIYDFYKEIVAEGVAERTPSRRAAYYALTDELQHRGHPMPAPQMREQVTPKMVPAPTAVDTAAVMAVAAAPTVAVLATAQLEPDDRDRVLSDALDRKFIQGRMERVHVERGGEAFELVGDTMRPRIHLPNRGQELPGLVAHELGHSTVGPFRRLLATTRMQTAHRLGQVTSVILPLLAVEGAGNKSFATPEELESRAKLIKSVGVVAGLAQAPVLAEEVFANLKAVKMLQQVGASRQEALLKVLKHAGPGFATYAVPAALPFLVARHLRRKARKGKKS